MVKRSTALKIVRLGPGLSFVVGIVSLATILANYLPQMGVIFLAILLGFLSSNFIPLPSAIDQGVSFAEKKLLSLAIILMGFSLNFVSLFKLGWQVLVLLMVLVFLTITMSRILGQWLGLSRSTSIMLGFGNAICGSSAIASSAPLITKNKAEIAVVICVVNLLGSLGLFFLPSIIKVLGMSDYAAGVLIGGSLQAVGQVVGAGYAVNNNVGELSLLVKMARICLLVPALFILSSSSRQRSDVSFASMWLQIPNYLYGFVFCGVLASLDVFPQSFLLSVKSTSNALLMMAMAAIGTKINLRDLLQQGASALSLGILIFSSQLAFLLGFVSLMGF